MSQRLEMIALPGFPLVEPGDNLVEQIIQSLREAGLKLKNGDLLVIAQKVISKAENRYVYLDQVKVSQHARELARPQKEFLTLLQGNDLAATVICPSNPFVSVEPMLAMPGVRRSRIRSRAPVIAVSPIVAGKAIKGPAAKMMQELSMPTSASGVAQYYGELLDGFIIDESDAFQVEAIEALGIKALVAPTIMTTLQDRIDLAQQVLQFSKSLV